MQKERVAFVVGRYGLDINGGAEYHCRMLAERLVGKYDVEVLTTCVRDYIRGGNSCALRQEVINGVLVRRFDASPIGDGLDKAYRKEAKPVRRLRVVLYKMRCLRLISFFMPVWNWLTDKEEETLKRSVFYSPEMNDYIKENKDLYKAFVAFTIDFAPFYYTGIYAGEKTIAIPTMHCEKDSFRAFLTKAFAKFAYVGFNTIAEQKLGRQVFGKAMKKSGIISVGIEEPQPASWEETQKKYNLPTEYLLYVGRVEGYKVGPVFEYFVTYKKRYPDSSLKLVLVGGIQSGVEAFRHPDVIYTGFVSEEEKMVILQHATVTVNPSRYESLSLILLEALNQEKMMLVNGHCKVLKEHCSKSGYAADFYMSQRQFVSKLHRIVSSPEWRQEKGKLGKQYVQENYNWAEIMKRLERAIEGIAS